MIRNRVVGWLGTALLLSLTGCAGFGGGAVATTADTPQGETYEKVRINYRADSARLAALALPRGGAQLASYEAGLPPCSLGTLEVRYPHPRLGTEWALVTAVYEAGPETPNSALESTSFVKRWSGAKDELPGLKGTHWSHEKWALDVPKWQMDRIVGQIRESGFFRSGRVISPDVFLAASVDGLAGRKNWKSFAELDALLLRAREQGQLLAQTLPPGSPPAATAVAQTGSASPPASAPAGYYDSLARGQAAPAGYQFDGWSVAPTNAAPPAQVMRLPEVP